MVLGLARVVALEDLLACDHAELERAVDLMASWRATADQRVALEAARLGFAAHAEAEANVLHRALLEVPAGHIVSRLLTRALGAHSTQEALLWRLARSVPNTVEWIDAVEALRASFDEHDTDERLGLLPIVREVLADEAYGQLASAYATERLRALAMMSAVVARVRARRSSARI